MIGTKNINSKNYFKNLYYSNKNYIIKYREPKKNINLVKIKILIQKLFTEVYCSIIGL